MKIFAFLLLATSSKVATAVCSVDDHHPVNGGYHIEGIAGHNKDDAGKRLDNPNSGVDYFYPWHNASWVPGVYVNRPKMISNHVIYICVFVFGLFHVPN